MNIESKFRVIEADIKDVNQLLSALTNNSINRFFDKVSLVVTFSAPEATLIRLISFIYIHLHEGIGKINYEFCVDKFDLYGMSTSAGHDFKRQSHCFRTVLQHNLLLENMKDSQKLNFYKDWLIDACGKEEDLTADDWAKCCDNILTTFSSILSNLKYALKAINSDADFKDLILSEWVSKIKTYYPLDSYVEIASTVFKNFGIETLDRKKFCERHHQKWLSELKEQHGFVFRDFAQKQIERDVILDFELNTLLPITGNDLMKEFGLTPGIHVKELLDKAANSYKKAPCNKEELLRRLKE